MIMNDFPEGRTAATTFRKSLNVSAMAGCLGVAGAIINEAPS